MKLPYCKFYPRDWMADPQLRGGSYALRGLAADMLCLMGMNEEHRGFLEIGGKPLTDATQIARLTSGDAAEVSLLLPQIVSANIFSKDDRGCFFSRRMVKDERLRSLRSEAGSKGGNASKQLHTSPQAILLKQKPEQMIEQNGKQNVVSGSMGSGSMESGPYEESSVELPPGFPTTAAAATAHADFVGCTPDFAVKVWNCAMGRGGRDARDVPVRNFRSHLAAAFAYERERQSKAQPTKTAQPTITQTHDVTKL